MIRHSLVCLIAVSLASCGHETKPEAPRAPPGEAWLSAQQMQAGQVVTQSIEERDLGATITTSGRVAFDDQTASSAATSSSSPAGCSSPA